jgi:hypothetical protein
MRNSVEPPWYGIRMPGGVEGWRREASPYPDLGRVPTISCDGAIAEIKPKADRSRNAPAEHLASNICLTARFRAHEGSVG